MGNILHLSSDWLMNSGAYKHIIGYKESFVNMSKHDSTQKLKLQDDYQYPIKGSGEASYKLDSRKSLNIKNVIYVQGLNNNILSISSVDAKGMRVSLFDGQFIMCPKEKILYDPIMIGEQGRGLYKLNG